LGNIQILEQITELIRLKRDGYFSIETDGEVKYSTGKSVRGPKMTLDNLLIGNILEL
jgi:hypothetical protein